MSTIIDNPDEELRIPTLEDFQKQLGGIPLRRVLAKPFVGTATEEDVLRIMESHDKTFELIDGVLVEKEYGLKESMVASRIGSTIADYLPENHCGYVSGGRGGLKFASGRIRFPDLAFFRYERLPRGVFPNEVLSSVTPDLVVEVLRKSNTPSEMKMKRADYFWAGVNLVWEIDLEARTAKAFTGPNDATPISFEGAFDGGDVLPGFTVPVAEIFAWADNADLVIKRLSG